MNMLRIHMQTVNWRRVQLFRFRIVKSDGSRKLSIKQKKKSKEDDVNGRAEHLELQT